MNKELVSLIIPCYNEEQVLPILKEALVKVMDEMSAFDFELLFVNDGSKDNTLNILKEYKEKYPKKFKITVFREYDDDEHAYEGVVMARDLGDAAQKLFKEFSYHDEAKKGVDCIVCDIYVEEYLDKPSDSLIEKTRKILMKTSVKWSV